MPSKVDAYGSFQVEDRAAWRVWLAANHGASPGIWLVTLKKTAGDRYLPYDATVEEALCFGWIDSKPGLVDAERRKLLFTPRKARSPWSALNKRRVVALIEEGRMTPAGLARIEAARANGDWAIYDTVETLVVPDDLAAALAATPGAAAAFAARSESQRKQLLWWVESARRAPTRETRIAAVAAEVAEGRNPLDWRAKQQGEGSDAGG